MRKFAFLGACALLASASALPASARPASGAANPQIAFVKASTSGRRQLIVANEDGSGATAIYTANQFMRAELAPNGMVYFFEGSRFGRIPATGGAPQWLFETTNRFGAASDLSPDGSNMAWFEVASQSLYRYHFATGQQQLVTSVPDMLDVTFDRTGQNIIFTTAFGSPGNYQLMIVPASGGTAVPYGLSGPYTNIDASHLDTTLVVTVHVPATAPYLGLWEPGMPAPIKIADGYNGTYRCDDSAIIYQRVMGSGSALFRRTSTGATTTIAKPEAVFPSYKQIC